MREWKAYFISLSLSLSFSHDTSPNRGEEVWSKLLLARRFIFFLFRSKSRGVAGNRGRLICPPHLALISVTLSRVSPQFIFTIFLAVGGINIALFSFDTLDIQLSPINCSTESPSHATISTPFFLILLPYLVTVVRYWFQIHDSFDETSNEWILFNYFFEITQILFFVC